MANRTSIRFILVLPLFDALPMKLVMPTRYLFLDYSILLISSRGLLHERFVADKTLFFFLIRFINQIHGLAGAIFYIDNQLLHFFDLKVKLYL